jgi:hypothetical protein
MTGQNDTVIPSGEDRARSERIFAVEGRAVRLRAASKAVATIHLLGFERAGTASAASLGVLK